MFIAALFTIIKTCKQSKCPLTVDQMKIHTHTHTQNAIFRPKENEIMSFAAT